MKDISAGDLQNNIPLVARKDFDRVVKVGKVTLSPDKVTIMAGPCTVESRGQVMQTAQALADMGLSVMRGGVFKPLTFPYGDPLIQPDADSGLPAVDRVKSLPLPELMANAERRLAYFREAADKHGLAVVSEITLAGAVEMMSPYVDMFQVGYRHMFNMDLIEALSRQPKPILLKRHYGESLRSLLGVAEHFEFRGKHDFAVCERGVTTPHTHNVESRAIIDIQVIPAMQEYAPSVAVIVDPSHSTFKRSYVAAISRAAVAAGAGGLLIEVHPDPEHAWVDPLQALGFTAFAELLDQLRGIAKVLGKTVQ